MRWCSLTAAFFGTTSALVAASCAPAHIIVARASTEPQGQGIIGALARTVARAVPGTTVEAVKYPAKLFPYADSSSKGTIALKSQLTAYVQSCPQSKIVLMGYSQVGSLD